MENRIEVLRYVLENIVGAPKEAEFDEWFEEHFQTKDRKIKKVVNDLIEDLGN